MKSTAAQRRNRHLIKALWLAQGCACFICDKAMDLPTVGEARELLDATKDHVIPRAKNGAGGWGNILLAHLKCNRKKADRLPTQRELQRIHTTLAAMEPEALRIIMESALNSLDAARQRLANAEEEVRNASAAAATVMRYAPTADAAATITRMSSPVAR